MTEQPNSLHKSDDRGSASLWVLGACALIAFVAAVAFARADARQARHRAEAAADLASLAAAERIGVGDDSCDQAARLALQNGARLTSCQLSLSADGRSGQVQVTVMSMIRLPLIGTRSATASARAEREPDPP